MSEADKPVSTITSHAQEERHIVAEDFNPAWNVETWYRSGTFSESGLIRALRNTAVEVADRLKVPLELQALDSEIRKLLADGNTPKLNRLVSPKFHADLYDTAIRPEPMMIGKPGSVQYVYGPMSSPAGKIEHVARRVLGEMIDSSVTKGWPFTLPRAHVNIAGYAVEFFFYSHVVEPA